MRLLAAAVFALASTTAGAQNIMDRLQRDPPKSTQQKESKKAQGSHSSSTAVDRQRVAPVPPATPPSPAVQQQRKMEAQQRIERPAQATSQEKDTLHCSAYPVCDRSSGSYGGCRGVEQRYSGKTALYARQDVARQCVDANTPDACNCAVQCSRVAHCSNI